MSRNTKMFTPERCSLLLLATALILFLLYQAYGNNDSGASSVRTEVDIRENIPPETAPADDADDTYTDGKDHKTTRHKKSRKKGTSKSTSRKTKSTKNNKKGKKRDHRNEPVPSF